jgi:hypothetical protein
MTFIPLFLQGVLGSSAILSGKMLTPMVLGSVIGSIVSGQVLSRAGGHYRLQAGMGFAVVALGFFQLSRLMVDTAHTTILVNMILIGLGHGIIMPLHAIAVQNALPYAIMGTATASIHLLRSLGGIFGLAFLGSVMNHVLYADFIKNVQPSIKTAVDISELSALAKNPQALINPNAHHQLKDLFESLGTKGETLFREMMATLQDALGSALQNVFFVIFCVVVLGFLTNFFLREIPLRKVIKDDP